jgi:hypothetical protein
MRIQADNWTPQVWSHPALLDMQSNLDPVRITAYADQWRRVIDDARSVFVRMDREVGSLLEQSWTGRAGRQALEALRRYIAEAVEALDQCRALADGLAALSDAASELRASVTGQEHLADLEQIRQLYSDPAVAAGNIVTPIPGPPMLPGGQMPQFPGVTAAATTVPAGAPLFGRDTTPFPMSHNNFGDFGPTAATYGASASPPPLPSAPLNAAAAMPVQPTPPASAPVPSRPAAPYLPVMGAGFPGGISREDATSRRTPRYLITIDNGNALIGPLPTVAPPVIGEW